MILYHCRGVTLEQEDGTYRVTENGSEHSEPFETPEEAAVHFCETLECVMLRRIKEMRKKGRKPPGLVTETAGSGGWKIWRCCAFSALV